MRVYDAILITDCDIALYAKDENGHNRHLVTISNRQEALHTLSREVLDKTITKMTIGDYNEIAINI